jgi:hypothetical protein
MIFLELNLSSFEYLLLPSISIAIFFIIKNLFNNYDLFQRTKF